MKAARRRTLVLLAFTASAAVSLVARPRDGLALAPAPASEFAPKPHRLDGRAGSLEWMPDVAERLRLLAEHGCRNTHRRLHGEVALEDPDRAAAACEMREKQP